VTNADLLRLGTPVSTVIESEKFALDELDAVVEALERNAGAKGRVM